MERHFDQICFNEEELRRTGFPDSIEWSDAGLYARALDEKIQNAVRENEQILATDPNCESVRPGEIRESWISIVALRGIRDSLMAYDDQLHEEIEIGLQALLDSISPREND